MNLKITANILNYPVLLLSAGISFWYGAGVLTQPFAISRVSGFLPMLLALFVFFNRIFSLILRKVDTRNHRIIFFIGKWLLTLFLPMLLMNQINEAANIKSKQIVTNKFANLVLHLETARQPKQSPPDDILNFLHKSKISKSFNYYSGPAEFMLTTEGGSIDIDGSTLYYHSDYKQWQYIHNDLLRAQSGDERIKKIWQAQNTLYRRFYIFKRQENRWLHENF